MARRRLSPLELPGPRVGLAWAVIGSVALGAGCAAGLPRPAGGAHPGQNFVVVPYPPPVVRVEEVPPRPDERAVWVDGWWGWSGDGYAWQPGRWIDPPTPDAHYAEPSLVRSPNGPLYFYPAQWYRSDGTPVNVGEEARR